ncbi:hypothetical protein BDY21DRAFT_119735 [Lineolata rhizophorae]|uniref:Uncharacterized protein n=1 Tax=Lineolata rhizophorae TaxID=578093 RepID=A0A6A6NQL7_9PEZI|nr:hypothetical protein BDY21DRAFT_119735 [Lineolata rhizophorae]
MFIIKFTTDTVTPNTRVVLRTSVDGWVNRGGEYVGGAWTFVLDEEAFPDDGFEFKFVIPPGRWMLGPNLAVGNKPADGAEFVYADAQVQFDQQGAAMIVEDGEVSKRLVKRNVDETARYDVIVIGSGMGGGVLAAELVDRGANVLVLEAGSLLFPTHIGNLPRRVVPGTFQKHVWSLWYDFKVDNYVNIGAGSAYAGAQGFNLGGRSVFWGGLIPPLARWELGAFPANVRDYLLSDDGYDKAKTRTFNSDLPSGGGEYQAFTREAFKRVVDGFEPHDAPMAVEYVGATGWSIPAGIFSTADLLLQNILTAPERGNLTINLNHAAWRVLKEPGQPNRIAGVQCYDLLAKKERTYLGDAVVLAAGTLESAKIALQSNLDDPSNLIGQGVTDHAILYRHFVVPKDHPLGSATQSAKFLLTHPDATLVSHAFDVIIELGSQLNQGRYVDPDQLAQDARIRAGSTLCEIVFQFYAPLNANNYVSLALGGDPGSPVQVHAEPEGVPQALLEEVDAIAKKVFTEFGAEPVAGENDPLVRDGRAVLYPADVGGVAHEVGTLRMGEDGRSVLDENLRFSAYENLYACDNSIFPASPAGNPSLTLAALAARLAGHLRPN